MVFKSVDGQLTTIFKKVESVNVGFNETHKEINDLVNDFNKMNASQSFGDDWDNFLDSVSSKNQNVADMFKNIAKQGASAQASIEDVYAAILNGNTSGFINAKSVIETFNSVDSSHQKDFANAVGQTNKNLGTYLSNVQSSSASMQEYGKYLVSTKAKTTALQVRTMALNAALNTTLVGLITWGIGKAIEWIDELIVTEEEAAEQVEELRQKALENAEAAKEEVNKISDLISQYEKFKDVTSLTANDKENLKSIQDQLIETFGREAEGIDLINGKYDEQIKKIKEASETKLKNYEISAEEAYKAEKTNSENNKSQVFYGGAYWSDSGYLDLNRRVYDNGKSVENTGLINALNNIDGVIYDSYGNGVIDVDAIGKSAAELSDIYLNILETLKKFSDPEFDFTQTDLYKDIVSNYQHYSEEADATYSAAESLIESRLKLYELSNGSYKGLGKGEYLQWLDEFKNQFDSNDEDLAKALEDKISQINIEVGDYISSQTSNNLEVFHNFIRSLKDSENGLKSHSESISDIISLQKEYSSIIEQQTNDGKLSFENINKIIKAGKANILVYDETVKGYKASIPDLNKISKDSASQELKKLREYKQELLLNYHSSKSQLEELRKNIRSESDIDLYLSKSKQLENEYKETNNLLNLYISLCEDSANVTNEYADSIEKVNEQLENQVKEIEKLESGQSTIDKAIEEQKEFGRLSASSIRSLHEAGLGTALAYNEATGETTLLIDSVEELYQAMIKAQEEASKISMNNLAAEIEEITNRLNNFTVSSTGDIQKRAELENARAEMQSRYDTQKKNIQVISSLKFDFNSASPVSEDLAKENAEEYINTAKEAFEKEKSELDHLLNMDVISQEEYYNSLFDLNEKYFKGKTELLDEYRQYEEEIYKGLKEVQIKALQEQIDSLKSVNEEKQEEIDLEKAKQALENAKRQRNIRVYDSERGWIYETDRNAVDSAQKEYDDLVLNEKVETLENLIDAIENGTNTTHNPDESVKPWEQVNSLGQRVVPGDIDLSKFFTGAVASTINDIQNSMYANTVPTTLANQFDKSISSDSYTTNNKTTYVNVEEVVAENPMAFISEMEQIADKSFEKNFPPAMDEFGRGLKRYRANHSI